MIRTYSIEEGQQPTPEQLQEVEEAKKIGYVEDSDAPELSEAMMKAFRCSIANRNRRKNA